MSVSKSLSARLKTRQAQTSLLRYIYFRPGVPCPHPTPCLWLTKACDPYMEDPQAPGLDRFLQELGAAIKKHGCSTIFTYEGVPVYVD